MAEAKRYWLNPEAQRAASKRYYESHPKARLDNLLRANTQRIHKRLVVNSYKAMGCTDCGEQDPIVLEFDHVRGKKMGNVSMMVNHTSWTALIREMNKCDIRCANCHARITATRYESASTTS